MNSHSEKSLILELDSDRIPGVSRFFQKGVMVETRLGCSVQAFLLDQLGLSPEYVEGRIQTIMLNGKVVDDPGAAAIPPGAILSLSAAMPGLLGATLRTGSYYAAMRSQISWEGVAPTSGAEKGTVVLKLFNLLIHEVGPRLLRRGIWVRAEDLALLLVEQTRWLQDKRTRAIVDGRSVDLGQLSHTTWGNGLVFLKLRRSQG